MKSRDIALFLMSTLMVVFLYVLVMAPGNAPSRLRTSYVRGPSSLFNIDTKYNREGSFRKEGLLRDHETGKLKPLLSRQISSSRHQYFTSENHDGFVLNVPLFDQQGRSCTSGAGCGSLFDGDLVRGLDGGTYSFLSL